MTTTLKSTSTFRKQPVQHRMKVHCIFLDAATVFEYDGDWRTIFKMASYKANGYQKKMFETMAKATISQMDDFVITLIKNTKQVRYEKTTSAT